MNKKKILITTAIDYTNDVIHIGQAYEKMLADCYARYYRAKLGANNVKLITGTDEHGTSNEKAAKARNLTPLEHVNDVSKKDQLEIDELNISYDRFIRTTDEDHVKTASAVFQKAYDNGDIYKSSYEGLYCEGCEAYKTLTELNEQGQCLLHPTRKIQKIQEENYFFKWTKYSDFLKGLVQSEGFVFPEGKRKEMLAFIENGIRDIPVTRPKYKLGWGITTPIDVEQVIYVWFDALINYYTFGSQNGFWDEDTQIIHFVGKDISRWHVLLWPAMLKSAGIRVPDVVYIHGFLTLSGEKISKSRGNVIKPQELVSEFGVDAVRYYFLKYGPILEDVDFTLAHLKEVYNSELANGLGNTVTRIARLAEKSDLYFPLEAEVDYLDDGPSKCLDDFRPDLALQSIWARLAELDKHINDNHPWTITDQTKLKSVLTFEVNEIRTVAKVLEPYIPKIAQKITKQFSKSKIVFEEGLFPRIK